MADTPTTKAGKRLLGQIAYYNSPENYMPGDLPWGWQDKYGSFIAAIGAEAVAAERARIEREVEALPVDAMCHDYEGRCGCGDPPMINRSAVVALLDPEPLADPGDHHVGVGK